MPALAHGIYYARRGATVEPSDICLTCSTSEAYSWLFQSLADPGDTVLVPAPSYPLFQYLAALVSVELRPYPLGHDGDWFLDLAALAEAVTDRTRAIITVTPNNPTGHYLKQAEADRLLRLCAERSLPLIADEVFADYPVQAPDSHCRSLAGRHDACLLVLNGLSKICGLPQMKAGWIAVHGPAAERQRLLSHLELIADTHLSVSAPIQAAVPQWLGWADTFQQDVCQRLQENLRRCQQLCRGTAVQPLPVEGGWYLILRLPAIQTDEAWALHLLREHHLYVLPGYLFDLPVEAHLVASLLTPPTQFEAGLQILLASVKTLLNY